jgi:anti-sigma factor RsiW
LLTCKQFLDELADYLDGGIAEELRRELDGHLAECPNCWVIVDTTKKTLRIYKGMEAKPLSPELHERLMKALQRKMARPPES